MGRRGTKWIFFITPLLHLLLSIPKWHQRERNTANNTCFSSSSFSAGGTWFSLHSFYSHYNFPLLSNLFFNTNVRLGNLFCGEGMIPLVRSNAYYFILPRLGDSISGRERERALLFSVPSDHITPPKKHIYLFLPSQSYTDTYWRMEANWFEVWTDNSTKYLFFISHSLYLLY
jgi:hypothetical protein